MKVKPNKIRIACWNARGFNSAVPYLRSLCDKTDIICLSEHWLHENKLMLLDEISEKILYHARASKFATAENYGTKRGQGGVAILWSKKLGGVSQISDIIHDRMCGIRIQTKKQLIINVISVYLPAQGSPENYEAILDDLSEFINSREIGSKTFVCGDANADIGSLGGPRSTRKPTHRGKVLSDFFNNFNLTAANMRHGCKGPINTFIGPTGSTCIDYIMVPRDLINQVTECTVLSEDVLNCSDHLPISICINVGELLPTTVKGTQIKLPKWNKVSDTDLKAIYTDIVDKKMFNILTFSRQIKSTEDIDNAIEKIVLTLTEASKAIPTSCYRPNLKPFWNSELKQLKVIKVRKFKTWVAEGRPRDASYPSWNEHKDAKKDFARAMRRVAREYENNQMVEAVNSCTTDKTIFWRHLKKCRGSSGSNVLAIANRDEKVVYEIKEILRVWKEHFATLSTPKNEPSYDDDHFKFVNQEIEKWINLSDSSTFTDTPINFTEVQKAVNKLKKNKACGYDNVSAEHVKYGGDMLIRTIVIVFNMIIDYEYIPINFRRGIQVPLFKGKNLSSTDTNNYRGITLLSTLSKIYELIIWGRLESWWKDNGIISQLQGACRKGQSCVHTSMMLQETVSSALETNKKVFVSYFDVSKAFDTVWINGLFYKLYQVGIKGKLWRLMYLTYKDFCCRARVAGDLSDWYPMSVGIHQGGILSLTKYLVFINDLLDDLEKSGLCCTIGQIRSSPASYADDLAAATISKRRTDEVHRIVNDFGNRWRFNFNASKSAVLVFGEERKERIENRIYRQFKLGKERVKEKDTYEHVGVQMSILDNSTKRVDDKISKGRKTLNASTGLGIRKSGLNMGTCNVIFWQVVVPTVTFGSEVWVNSDCDKEHILSFQRYAGRRIQRFPHRAPNASSFYGLGWLKLTSYIMVKKLLFVLTVIRMDQDSVLRRILECRLCTFIEKRDSCRNNSTRSPIFDILNVAITFGLFETIKNMVLSSEKIMSKKRVV